MANLKKDRRSQRTKRILIEALASLIQEKRYELITVQNIIDRADVGRSTFYQHYHDKEDLMASMLARMMDALSRMVEQQQSKTGSPRLLPTRELFEHVQKNQRLFRGVARGHGLELFSEKAQEYWSQKIAAELYAHLSESQRPAVPVPVMAHFVSGTMLLMLRWWLDNKMPYSPKEMDDMLQRLVVPGIRENLNI